MSYKIICKKTQFREPRKYNFSAVVRISGYAKKAGVTYEEIMASEILSNGVLDERQQVSYEITEITNIIDYFNTVADFAQDAEVAIASFLAWLNSARIPPALGFLIKRIGLIRILLGLGLLLEAISKMRLNTDALKRFNHELKIAIIHAKNF